LSQRTPAQAGDLEDHLVGSRRQDASTVQSQRVDVARHRDRAAGHHERNRVLRAVRHRIDARRQAVTQTQPGTRWDVELFGLDATLAQLSQDAAGIKIDVSIGLYPDATVFPGDVGWGHFEFGRRQQCGQPSGKIELFVRQQLQQASLRSVAEALVQPTGPPLDLAQAVQTH